MEMRRTPTERLALLEKKKLQLVDKIAMLSAREKMQTLKDDNRRRTLLGTIVLADMASNASLAAYIRSRLGTVIREGDKRLFADLLSEDEL